MRIKVSRKCKFCGQVFTGTYKSRYCSNAHRQAAYRRRVVYQPAVILDQGTIL